MLDVVENSKTIIFQIQILSIIHKLFDNQVKININRHKYAFGSNWIEGPMNNMMNLNMNQAASESESEGSFPLH